MIIETIANSFSLTKKDAGKYAAFKASPLTITLEWYFAEGLGNVCLLRGKAMGGLMLMDTLVINFTLRDMPLFSYDYIAAMGKYTMLVEYYDTLLNKSAFDAAELRAIKSQIAAIPDYDLGKHWYDSIKLDASFAKRTKKSATNQLNDACNSVLATYLVQASNRPLLDEATQALKLRRGAEYVNGLLENGGPSTDAFTKALGKERTRDLFTRIVFGTQE